MINDILKTNVGLEGVLDVPFDNHLPEARDIARNLSNDFKVEDLYRGNMFNAVIESAFSYKLDNNELLQPSNMRNAINSLHNKIKDINDGAVSSFVKEDLVPLMDNTDLLNMYMNMMVNG